MSSNFEAEQLIEQSLNKLQKNKFLKNSLAGIFVCILLYFFGNFVYDMIPQQYTLKITGGDILSQRHLLAKTLEEEAAKEGITLVIHPVSGSVNALEQVNSGKLDLAFIQGGLNLQLENVEHVATVSTEILHLITKPEIKNIQDLRGKAVNLGSRSGGTRVVATKLMNFVGLYAGVDFAELNDSAEDVLGMHPNKLPDAMFVVSTAPSYVVERMVRRQGYHLLEIPFPEALSLREGWVSGEKILAYTYNTQPPEPDKDIKSIGVNTHLVANKNVSAKAVAKVLESLYSPQTESKLRIKLDENKITIPSGFPISPATEAFLKRKDTYFSAETMENIQKGIGAVMTLLTLVLMAVKWFSGGGMDDNGTFKGYVKQIAILEEEANRMRAIGNLDLKRLEELRASIIKIRLTAMQNYPSVKLTDATIMDKVINSSNGALQEISAMIVQIQLPKS